MSEADVFILSERALAAVIDQVADDQWGEVKPEWFQTGAQGDASLREIVNYHAFDSAWVPDVLAGKTIAEVGNAHDHVKTDPACDYRPYSDAAIAAFGDTFRQLGMAPVAGGASSSMTSSVLPATARLFCGSITNS